jgi:hypothetical protein
MYITTVTLVKKTQGSTGKVTFSDEHALRGILEFLAVDNFIRGTSPCSATQDTEVLPL